MPLLIRLALIAVTAFAAGTILAPVWWRLMQETGEVLSPFLLIAVAILIASLGYAIGNFRR